MALKLSVLDQSFARSPDQAAQALQETLQMAAFCEDLGYHRFWVSEHHAFPTIAGSAPEVLLAALGAATDSIRLGSGGIMLPHYSAYKVAEVFSLLANLYPGRIDLGVGRAPGADMETAVALATDGRPKFERFGHLLSELFDYLRNPSCKPLLSPRPPLDIPIWILGTSSDSALLAAEKGLPYNLGLFINPQADAGITAWYQRHFQPTAEQPRPYTIVTMSVFCAESEQQAKALQLTFDVNFFRYITGQRDAATGGGLLTPEQAQVYPMNAQLQAFIASRGENRAVGTPAQVKLAIEQVAQRYAADEVMVVSNMYYFEDRKRSFQLLKEVFAC